MNDWQIFTGNGEPHNDWKLPESPKWRPFGKEIDPNQSRSQVRGETFQPREDEIKMVNAALYLRRPLLITGKPGTGKSSLAYAVARELMLGEVLYWPITSRTILKDGLYNYDAIALQVQRLSWSFDNNQSAASITFRENSENSYFWEDNQRGKLFEGWLNYPNEDRIDFRGRFVTIDPPEFSGFTFKCATIIFIDDSINIQTFDFEVAFIQINRWETSPDNNNILQIVDEAVFSKIGQHLTDIEQLLLNGALENLTYKQIYNRIVESTKYSESEEYLRHRIGGQLWKVLTEIVGENVNKRNLKAIINQWAARSHLTIDRYSAQATGFFQDLGSNIQLEMILIPGDTFVMGSPPEELEHQDYESPQHTVTVQPFFMSKYPVTQAQWQVVAALPQVNRELEPDPSNFKGANRPVENVTWYDAVEFCDRLSQHTGKSYYLPSEAEWEYACRAGTTTPFHFGETITSELANYNATKTYGAGVKGTYRQETTVVGSFGVANAFGLYDMHGNVWEWCLDDWHENYEGAPRDGSAWLDNNDNLSQKREIAVLRGGSWVINPGDCRSASRDCNVRGIHYGNSRHFWFSCCVGCREESSVALYTLYLLHFVLVLFFSFC